MHPVLRPACLRASLLVFSADDHDANTTGSTLGVFFTLGMFCLRFFRGWRSNAVFGADVGLLLVRPGLGVVDPQRCVWRGWQLDWAIGTSRVLAKGLLCVRQASLLWSLLGVFCVWWANPHVSRHGQQRCTSHGCSCLRGRWSLRGPAACILCLFRGRLLPSLPHRSHHRSLPSLAPSPPTTGRNNHQHQSTPCPFPPRPPHSPFPPYSPPLPPPPPSTPDASAPHMHALPLLFLALKRS